MKNVTVIVSEAPGSRTAEKLRMSVGLTLEDGNAVTVLLIDDGVYAALGLDREKTGVDIDKHLKMLEMMKKAVIAHKPSMEARGIANARFGIKEITDGELGKILAETDAVL